MMHCECRLPGVERVTSGADCFEWFEWFEWFWRSVWQESARIWCASPQYGAIVTNPSMTKPGAVGGKRGQRHLVCTDAHPYALALYPHRPVCLVRSAGAVERDA
jgi:hypothetical protein